jgi:hypothetical protein
MSQQAVERTLGKLLTDERLWRRNYPMLQRTFVAVPAAIALVVLVVGCAGPTTSSASSPATSALAPPSELAGTWAGTFGMVAADARLDEGRCVVQITEDQTFTATCGRNGGANNVAKASTWSGKVVTRGNRITFRTAQGPWVTLVRSGNTLYGVANDPLTLYGVANDPLTGMTIMIRFEQEVSGQAEKKGRGYAGSTWP